MFKNALLSIKKIMQAISRKKLRDGKPLTGKNRLTLTTIDILQNYYGMAIRENTHNLTDMVDGVLAVLYHVVRTNDKPNHSMSPVGENSWCGWQRNSTTYKRRHDLPEAVIELLEPVLDAGMRKRKRSFFCGSGSAKIPPLPLPHRREESREERNWFCYPSEKSE